MPKSIPEALAALVLVAGLALFVRGVYLAWRPGGWMVAGLFVAAPAFFFLYLSFRKSLGSNR